MRVLFVTSLYIPWVGGLEILVRQLIQEFRSRGHEALVITGQGVDADSALDWVDGVPVHRISTHRPIVTRDAAELLRAQLEITRIVREFEPDVTHAHDGGPMLWMYQRATRKSDTALVVTLHNVMTRHFEGALPVLAKLLQEADAVTGVSEAVVRDTLTFAPAIEPRLSLIRNGVVPPVSQATPLPSGPPTLVCIGRLVAQKGFDVAIRAMAELVPGHPDTRLLIAGGGTQQRALYALVEELGLTAHVEFLGIVERDRVAVLLEECTTLVMPSRFEGLPLVALEAAWAGRPTVGTRAPGLSEAVVDGETGVLVAVDDAPALAAAIHRVLDDRALGERLGARARARAEREYSLRACADAYEQLYRTVLSGRR